MRGMRKFASVADYLKAVPPAQRALLKKLRRTIKAAAPKATEVISYGIPAYKHHGMLVYFAAFKDHCSLFRSDVARHAREPGDHLRGLDPPHRAIEAVGRIESAKVIAGLTRMTGDVRSEETAVVLERGEVHQHAVVLVRRN